MTTRSQSQNQNQNQVVVVAAAKPMPNGVKFVLGGLSGMGATLFVQPLDLIKNRMQLAGRTGQSISAATVVRNVIKSEGVFGLYTGLSAGLLRQATYTTTRLGVYTTLIDHLSKDGKAPSFALMALSGLTAGACGAIIGNPTEVALIRMSSDGFMPIEERRNYKNVIDAIIRVTREEGVLTLWRGCMSTVARAMVVNATQLATYSKSKAVLVTNFNMKEGIPLHFWASMVSGFCTTAASMPVDIVKTRIQNMRVVNGVPEYKGIGDVLSKVVRKEGFFALWKGFLPYYARIGPHTVITFIFLEQLNKAYRKYVQKS